MTAFHDRVIMTTSGPVTGISVDGVSGYLGIPYAAPPVGALRWKPPVAPEPWKEPRLMNQFGDCCPQAQIGSPQKTKQMSEDCLTLNIWTSATSDIELLPVMVFLHGGGLLRGSGSEPLYNSTYLAKKGVVLVTINYRIGVLGFIAHAALTAESPHQSSGNYAIMDQIMALRWVKENIRQFGGNPDNVTLWGQSAGAASVITLMASTLTKGLFHRAIAQSSGYAPSVMRHLNRTENGLESMESLGMGFAEKLGITNKANPLEEMRARSCQELVDAWEKAMMAKHAGTGISGAWILNHIGIDGYVLTQSLGTAFKSGRQQNVPFITGITADEGSVMPYLNNLHTAERCYDYLKKCFGQQWQKILELYPAADTTSVLKAVSKFQGDVFIAGARSIARSMSALQPKTYLYQFAMQPKIFTFPFPHTTDWQKEFGCYHAGELPYLFHFLSDSAVKDEDLRLSEQMIGYWVSFSRNGDPNGDKAQHWPEYNIDAEQYLILDDPIKIGHNLAKDTCESIEKLAINLCS